MKKILAVLLAVALLASMTACAGSGSGKYTVGICQLVQHDALDAATKGFRDALTEALGDEVVLTSRTLPESPPAAPPLSISSCPPRWISSWPTPRPRW